MTDTATDYTAVIRKPSTASFNVTVSTVAAACMHPDDSVSPVVVSRAMTMSYRSPGTCSAYSAAVPALLSPVRRSTARFQASVFTAAAVGPAPSPTQTARLNCRRRDARMREVRSGRSFVINEYLFIRLAIYYRSRTRSTHIITRLHVLANILRSRYVAIATQPMQIRPIVHS